MVANFLAASKQRNVVKTIQAKTRLIDTMQGFRLMQKKKQYVQKGIKILEHDRFRFEILSVGNSALLVYTVILELVRLRL